MNVTEWSSARSTSVVHHGRPENTRFVTRTLAFHPDLGTNCEFVRPRQRNTAESAGEKSPCTAAPETPCECRRRVRPCRTQIAKLEVSTITGRATPRSDQCCRLPQASFHVVWLRADGSRRVEPPDGSLPRGSVRRIEHPAAYGRDAARTWRDIRGPRALGGKSKRYARQSWSAWTTRESSRLRGRTTLPCTATLTNIGFERRGGEWPSALNPAKLWLAVRPSAQPYR